MSRLVISLLIVVAGILTASGQVCTGSLGAPVVNETFGVGSSYNPGPPLTNGVTDLQYTDAPCGGEDGEYAILSSLGSSCKGGTWKYIGHDHTGDKNGYMMIINASFQPNVFFTYRVKGNQLCPNSTYQFSAWILNILRNLPQTKGYVEPNITFSIESADGTVLKSFSTGNIPADDNEVPNWIQFGTFFTSPSDGSDVIVKMTNNSAGGLGNDLALDDITFSPCGPLVQRGFGVIGDVADKSSCLGDNLTYTLVAQQEGYPDPGYQWQVNKNDGNGWVDIPGAITTSYVVGIPAAAVGLYQYRIGVLSSANAGSEKCRIYSDPLNINVYPLPNYPLLTNTGFCLNHPARLQATGGDSYLWTGPNGFTSSEDSPLLSESATPALNGVYTLRITKNNCPFFATTTVTVSPGVTIEPLRDTSVCLGSSIQINLKSSNATVYKWTPATGLDRDDIANPTASPLLTTRYVVNISNDACPDLEQSAALTITVNRPPLANAGSPIRYFEGQNGQLKAKADGDSIRYFWTPSDYLDNPNSLTPVTNAPANITYTLHVVSLAGCGESTSTVFVRVYKKLKIVNAFTPNGDGINDYWTIGNMDDYPHATVSVFDRGGQNIFQSIGYGKQWDGTFGGKKVPPGTYYYVIDFSPENIPRISGWVAILY